MKRQSHLFCLGLAAGLTLAGSSFVLAQSPAAETIQQKVGLPMQTVSPLPTSSSDADLGEIDVVQRYPMPEMFTFSTTQDFFYTDNVFYANTAPIASLAYLGSYTGSFVPYSLRDWTPRITFQYNMVRYDSAAAGDFDNENLAFSNQYVFSDDRAWTWTAAINLSRYTAPHANDAQFYKEVVYDNQISHVQQLLKGTPLFLIAAYDLAYHQANPGAFDRLDNGLSFSLSYYPVSQVSINFYVRPAARIYFTDVTGVQADRNDFNLSEGLDVTWTPCKYAAISADVSHADDYSNNVGFSYSDTSPGVSLTGTYKF